MDDFFDDDSLPINSGPDSLEGIESPDLSKMLPLKRGTATFYYKTEERLERAKAKFQLEDEEKEKRISDFLEKLDIREKAIRKLHWIKAKHVVCGRCQKCYITPNKHFRCADKRNKLKSGLDKRIRKVDLACVYFKRNEA